MEIGNIEDDNFCSRNPDFCGKEAGCHPLGKNDHVCLCYDSLPAGPNNNCDRDKEVSSLHSTNYSKDSPSESPFGSHQLKDMLIPPGEDVSSLNSTNNSNISPSESPFGSHQLKNMLIPPGEDKLWLKFVLASSFVVFILLTAAGIYLWRRRRRKKSALRKSMQQYITNPNYYSTSVKNIEISPENVTLVEEIGEGFFSKVYKGLYNTESGQSVAVAVKTLKDGHEADFEQEVSIMSSFNHQNILQLLGVVIKDNHSPPWMVFEFMQYGDLAQLLRSNSTTNPRPAVELSEIDLMSLSQQIANGMCYLSSQHFIHRDLATRNCLVGDHLTVKISDFGLSRDIYTSDYYRVGGSRMLPVRWMSPESITYGKFSLQSDVWSFGVLLWEIFTYAKQPYYGHSNDEVVKLILQGILLSPPENCPPSVCRIMAGCWKTDPRNRLAFPQILDMLSE